MFIWICYFHRKKRCPGYDGVRVETVCSGNGVCNMGIDGTGRAYGGMGGMSSVGGTMPLYKDVDIRPREAESQWCAVWSNNVEKCEKQPYCWMDGEECRPTHDKHSIPTDYIGDDRPAIPKSFPNVQEYPYYFVNYRDFTSWVWPRKKSMYYRYSLGWDIDMESMQALFSVVLVTVIQRIVKGIRLYPVYYHGIQIHRSQQDYYNIVQNRFFADLSEQRSETFLNNLRVEHGRLYDAKRECDNDPGCLGIEKWTDPTNALNYKYYSMKYGAIPIDNPDLEDPNYVRYDKSKKGEEGCIDFQRCGPDGAVSGSNTPKFHAHYEDKLSVICPGANAAGGDREIGIPNMIDGFRMRCHQ